MQQFILNLEQQMAEFKVSRGSNNQLMELPTSAQISSLRLLITLLLGTLKALPSPSLWKHSLMASCDCPYRPKTPLCRQRGRWGSH